MNIKRIFPMEINLRLRNAKEFLLQKRCYIPEMKKKSARCFYLDAATYNNLGDQAIALSMELFLDDLFGQDNVFVINETEVIAYLKSLKKEIKKDDVIVLSGGGNMGDLYPRYESIRRLIIKSFPNNKIVIFPQTLDYGKDKYGRKEYIRAKKIYQKHDNLWICAREEKSYKELSHMCSRVLLIPDIVFYLYGKVKSTTQACNQVGICLRNDKESALTEKDKRIIYKLVSFKGMCNELTTMASDGVPCLTKEKRMKAISQKIDEFSANELIVTDRLHGMIFSVLADVPCIAIDNKNHKVSGVYEMVRHQLKSIEIIKENQIENLREIPIPNECGASINVETLYAKLRNVLVGGKVS